METLTDISSSDLIDMLMKHTEYYMTLPEGRVAKNDCKKMIDLLIEEIRSREGFKELVVESGLEVENLISNHFASEKNTKL